MPKIPWIELTCTKCGASYKGKNRDRKYCDACTKENQKIHMAEWRKQHADKPKPVKKVDMIALTVIKAEKKRMSYGQYVSKYGVG